MLVGKGGRPFAHRTVTGNHALRGQGAKLAECGQPAADAPVQHVWLEHQIAGNRVPVFRPAL